MSTKRSSIRCLVAQYYLRHSRVLQRSARSFAWRRLHAANSPNICPSRPLLLLRHHRAFLKWEKIADEAMVRANLRMERMALKLGERARKESTPSKIKTTNRVLHGRLGAYRLFGYRLEWLLSESTKSCSQSCLALLSLLWMKPIFPIEVK